MSDAVAVLVVDDDEDVREMVSDYLTNAGFKVYPARNAAEARQLLDKQPVQVAVLDVRMPGEDGLSLARYMREHFAIGIVMLTAADQVVDRIVGLEVGADDYLTKPFDLRELLARIRSVLRRIAGAAGRHAGQARFGRCVLESRSGRLLDEAGIEVPITVSELELLRLFARHPNQALSRDEILDATQHRRRDPFDRSVDLHVTRLRRKIEFDPEKPTTIRTVRGLGYLYSSQGA